MKNIFIKLLYIIIISLFVTSCGLPSYTVVKSPVKNSDESTYLGFSAPSDDSNISGYEIYYKIYKISDPDIDKDENKFLTTASNYTYDFGVTKLNQLNFKRLMRADDGTMTTAGSGTKDAPSYPFINAGTNIYQLDSSEICRIFLGSTTDYIVLDFGGSSTVNGTPLRIATDSTVDKNFKNFSHDTIESTDSDRNGAEGDSNYTVSFVVYSYVNSAILVDYENSLPIFLGSMDISIIP